VVNWSIFFLSAVSPLEPKYSTEIVAFPIQIKRGGHSTPLPFPSQRNNVNSREKPPPHHRGAISEFNYIDEISSNQRNIPCDVAGIRMQLESTLEPPKGLLRLLKNNNSRSCSKSICHSFRKLIKSVAFIFLLSFAVY